MYLKVKGLGVTAINAARQRSAIDQLSEPLGGRERDGVQWAERAPVQQCKCFNICIGIKMRNRATSTLNCLNSNFSSQMYTLPSGDHCTGTAQ